MYIHSYTFLLHFPRMHHQIHTHYFLPDVWTKCPSSTYVGVIQYKPFYMGSAPLFYNGSLLGPFFDG